jgi:putative membrane protein
VTLHDFTLSREGTDFRIRYGLLTRVALMLRVKRIQSVHRTQSVLHRWFGRVSLRVDLAGDGGGDAESQGEKQQQPRWLAPICTPERADELIALALPTIDLHHPPDWQPLAPRAFGRVFRQTLYLWLIVTTVPAALWLGLPGIAVTLAGLPLAWWRARIHIKYTHWALTPDAILFRTGWLTRRLAIVPRDRVQSVQLTASPFDRRHAMAGVNVDTAGASLRGYMQIPMLEQDVARRLAMALYHGARFA